jgi:hypothetical protein
MVKDKRMKGGSWRVLRREKVKVKKGDVLELEREFGKEKS